MKKSLSKLLLSYLTILNIFCSNIFNDCNALKTQRIPSYVSLTFLYACLNLYVYASH